LHSPRPNGTQAIEKAKDAKEVILVLLLNLNTIAQYYIAGREQRVDCLCSWKSSSKPGRHIYAGALVESLKNISGPDCDAPLAAQHLYNIAKNDMVNFLMLPRM